MSLLSHKEAGEREDELHAQFRASLGSEVSKRLDTMRPHEVREIVSCPVHKAKKGDPCGYVHDAFNCIGRRVEAAKIAADYE